LHVWPDRPTISSLFFRMLFVIKSLFYFCFDGVGRYALAKILYFFPPLRFTTYLLDGPFPPTIGLIWFPPPYYAFSMASPFQSIFTTRYLSREIPPPPPETVKVHSKDFQVGGLLFKLPPGSFPRHHGLKFGSPLTPRDLSRPVRRHGIFLVSQTPRCKFSETPRFPPGFQATFLFVGFFPQRTSVALAESSAPPSL